MKEGWSFFALFRLLTHFKLGAKVDAVFIPVVHGTHSFRVDTITYAKLDKVCKLNRPGQCYNNLRINLSFNNVFSRINCAGLLLLNHKPEANLQNHLQ